MRKAFFSFTVLAITAATILSGCTKTKTCDYNETTQLGGYSGGHSILGGIYTFDDSLTITNPTSGDKRITIVSQTLGVPLYGTFDDNNCGRVTLDSVFIDSTTIESVTLKNIKAGGYGIFNGTKLNTVISFKSGLAIVSGNNVPLSSEVPLTGTFTKK